MELGYTGCRRGGRTLGVRMGGSVSRGFIIIRWWSPCISLTGITTGGDGRPDRAIQLSRPEYECHQNDGNGLTDVSTGGWSGTWRMSTIVRLRGGRSIVKDAATRMIPMPRVSDGPVGAVIGFTPLDPEKY